VTEEISRSINLGTLMKARSILSPVLAVIALYFPGGYVGATATTTATVFNCQDLLTNSNELVLDTWTGQGSPTVMPVKIMPGPHGGSLTLVERKSGQPWGSAHQDFSNAIQGDPRAFIDISDIVTAKFFGFEMKSNSTMTIPNAKEFYAAIEKVNSELLKMGEPSIPFRFVTPESGQVESKAFAEHFMNLEIPLASGGNVEVHDASYHAPAIFIPVPYIERALLLASTVSNFESFVRSRFPQIYNEPRFNDLLENAYIEVGNQFDFGTGNFSRTAQMLRTRKKDGDIKSTARALRETGIDRLVLNGSSPGNALNEYFKKAKYHDERKQIHPDLDRAFKEWWENYMNFDDPMDSNRNKRLYGLHLPEAEEVIRQFEERVSKIQEAVRRLKNTTL